MDYPVMTFAVLVVMVPLTGGFMITNQAAGVTGQTEQTNTKDVADSCSYSGGISEAVDTVKDCAGSIISATQDASLSAIQGVFIGISGLLGTVANLVSGLGSIADGLSDSRTFDLIPGSDKIIGILNNISGIGGVLENLAGVLGDFANAIANTVMEVKELIYSIPNEIRNLVDGMIGALNSYIFEPIIGSITGLTSWFKGAADNVIELIRKAFGL